MLTEKTPQKNVVYDHSTADNIYIPDSDLLMVPDVFHSNETSYMPQWISVLISCEEVKLCPRFSSGL